MTDIAHNVGKNYKMSAKAQNFLHFICESRRNMLLLQRKNKKERKMLHQSAYFYGYYFYFASNCEAVSCM